MEANNFIKTVIDKDIESNKYGGKVLTRFPPEPNGYLHIGHAKSICLNFGLAKNYNTDCHLRFDDTNPVKEDQEFIDAIIYDVKWLGFDWKDKLFYASDYFDRLFDAAVVLIKKGLAYVCDLNSDELREYRGTLTSSGKDSPYRNRSIEENLNLFYRMKDGEFQEGSRTLRAKIDMSSPNINMRDPAIYRIKFAEHHRTGNSWCIYPMYDFTHCLSDAYEGITHSICTLEFEDHRPLYDWFIEAVDYPWHPIQIEFARLNLKYTVMSKRMLLELVNNKFVEGWDDPRMPTIAGLRRRGYTPNAIRNFCEIIGVSKADSIIDLEVLENVLRDDLNKNAQRAICIINPLKITITNYDENKEEIIEAVNNPNSEIKTYRNLSFSKTMYIEQDDFMLEPPKDFFRLKLGGMVRLKYAYIIKCNELIKDSSGKVIELLCEYLPDTKSGTNSSSVKVKGTIHSLSIKDAIDVRLNIYDKLFNVENFNNTEGHFTEYINKNSKKIIDNALIEKNIISLIEEHKHFQFERQGYFCIDKDSEKNKLIFNKTVSLKDSWAKINKQF